MKKFKSLFKCRLDERQLKIRGNIYFKSFSVLSFIIIAIFFIKEIFNIKKWNGSINGLRILD